MARCVCILEPEDFPTLTREDDGHLTGLGDTMVFLHVDF